MLSENNQEKKKPGELCNGTRREEERRKMCLLIVGVWEEMKLYYVIIDVLIWIGPGIKIWLAYD